MGLDNSRHPHGENSEAQDSLAENLKERLAKAEAERDSLASAVRELESLINTNPDILYVHSLEGKLIRWNRGLEALTGLNPEQLMGKPTLEFVVEEDRPEVMARMAEVFQKGFSTVEARFFGKDGKLVPYHCNGSVILDEKGAPVAFVGTGRDITDRKNMEEDLRRAKEQAESANALKDKFIALVSHDIRSPLSGVINFLKMIRAGAETKLDEQSIMALGKAISNCEGMVTMVDQLLNISKMKTGKIKLAQRYHHPRRMCQEIIDSINGPAKAKKIEFVNLIPADTRIFVDRDLLLEVIRNVTMNAVKFSQLGGKVTFFVPDGRENTIAIKDNGLGVSQKIIGDLFRHDVKTSTLGPYGEAGSGLGLPLCADIMEAHGGSITVESTEGEGSVFYINMQSVKAIVLLVDDQEAVRAIYKEQLKDLGAAFMEAESGLEALEAIESVIPHLVITDFYMAKMDGFELLQALRSNSRTASIPVIMATSSATIDAKEKAFALGASDFVTKPVSPEDFIPRVKRFIG